MKRATKAIVGVINQNETLLAILELQSVENMVDVDVKIDELANPIHTVQEIDSVGDVLDEFVKRREHMFMVKDEFGQVTGLITLEDAIETLLGVEIVDETDSVVDMRKLALDNWRKKRRKTQE